MILADFYHYLSSDSTLLTLIGGTSTDSRIYPGAAPKDTPPVYITYASKSETPETEYLRNCDIEIAIIAKQEVAGAAALIENIVARLEQLLDLQDNIQGVMTSSAYDIKWSRKTDGQGPFLQPDTRFFYRMQMFELKYHLK